MSCKETWCIAKATYDPNTKTNEWLQDPDNSCCGSSECIGFFIAENRPVSDLLNLVLNGDLYIKDGYLYGYGTCAPQGWSTDVCSGGDADCAAEIVPDDGKLN